jgi:hypothetical protein
VKRGSRPHRKARSVSTNLFEPSGGALPAIPVWLSHRPVLAGLAVPWVTARGADGRFLFGALDRQRQEHAIGQHRCQVCGRALGTRTVLLIRLSDLPRKATSEPGLDPVCAAYSAAACPMIAGRMSHYRSSPPTMHPDSVLVGHQAQRYGAKAEPWFAVWLKTYEPRITDRDQPVASYAGLPVLRIRPITWRQLLPW